VVELEIRLDRIIISRPPIPEAVQPPFFAHPSEGHGGFNGEGSAYR